MDINNFKQSVPQGVIVNQDNPSILGLTKIQSADYTVLSININADRVADRVHSALPAIVDRPVTNESASFVKVAREVERKIENQRR